MPNFNRLTLLGNLTRDPELRFTAKGTAVLNGSIATNERWTDAQGEKQERVCYCDFTIWGKPAETFSQYTAKGSCVLLDGRLTWEEYDHEGQTRRRLFQTVEAFQFIDRKPEEKPNANANSRATGKSNSPRGERKTDA